MMHWWFAACEPLLMLHRLQPRLGYAVRFRRAGHRLCGPNDAAADAAANDLATDIGNQPGAYSLRREPRVS